MTAKPSRLELAVYLKVRRFMHDYWIDEWLTGEEKLTAEMLEQLIDEVLKDFESDE